MAATAKDKAQSIDVTTEMNYLMSLGEHKSPHEDDERGIWEKELYDGKDFFDDVTGKSLNHDMAVEARRLEMQFFRRMKVYSKVPRSEAVINGCKVITTRWLDINKGDDVKPNLRARLVGRELKLDNRLDLFAATPPLEALRLICAICANNQFRDNPFRILSVDVRRAYFYAKVSRSVYIEIPAEDWQPGDEGKVARLNLSLYGTRDAAQNWAAEYTSYLQSLGFLAGKGTPCNFRHTTRELYLSVHGDDFTITGPEEDLKWLEKSMTARYEIKSDYLGPARHHKQEIRVLNRTLRWSARALQYEPDQRHAELIVKEMGMEGAKPAVTPGTAETKEETKAYDKSPELSRRDAAVFRGLAARLNYLSLDRPDLQFSAKEVAKKMSKPREADWAKLKRVAKYLVGAPRLVQQFDWQDLPSNLHTYTDSDWAGDRESRKSTSGGAVTWGRHTLKTWATTQAVIALSSGEAELYSLVKGAAQSYGIMAMLADFGLKTGCTVCTDASAAMSMVHRQGLGKTRHIEVQYLWVQQDVYSGKLKVVKVRTDANPADLMTKHLKQETVQAHLERLSYRAAQGRAASAPGLMSCMRHIDGCVGRARATDPINNADMWEREEGSNGQPATVRRLHRKPRHTLFTPMKVAGGPKNAATVGNIRVTVGYFKDGQSFCKVDKWKISKEPHERITKPWTGMTMFIHHPGA